MVPWRVVEHTADVGIEAWGETWEEAICSLVEGFTALVCPDGQVANAITRTLEIDAATRQDLLVDLLDELNFVHQTEGFLPAAAKVDLAERGHGLRIELTGEHYDPERHGHLMEIKAATFHGIEVDEAPPRALVIVDI